MYTNLTNKKIKQFLPLLILFVLLVPVFVNAEPIIPCGGLAEDGKTPQPPCDFNMLMKLVNKIINWIIWISAPVAAGVFAWAGIKYMTTGIADQKSEAKDMLQKVFIGFVVILSAWIIVGTSIKALLKDPKSVPIDVTSNKSINFYV